MRNVVSSVLSLVVSPVFAQIKNRVETRSEKDFTYHHLTSVVVKYLLLSYILNLHPHIFSPYINLSRI